MELNIGGVIFKMRKEKGITQEQLAQALGISTSAVSKWEIGSAYPDITMLAPIARFFKSSIDSLLEYESELCFEAITNMGKNCVKIFETAGFHAGLGRCKKNVQEYPNSLLLKYHMAMIIYQYLMLAVPEKQVSASELAVKWLEQSAKIERPIAIRYASLHYLSQFYMFLGRPYEAGEAVKDISNEQGLFDFDNDLATAYLAMDEDEKAAEISQKKLYLSLSYVINAVTNLVTIARNKGDFSRAVDLLNAQREIIQAFKMDISLLVYNISQRAATHCHERNEEATLSALEEAAGLISTFERAAPQNSVYFDKVDYITTPTSAKTMKESFSNAVLRNSIFGFVENTDRYKAVIEKITRVEADA